MDLRDIKQRLLAFGFLTVAGSAMPSSDVLREALQTLGTQGVVATTLLPFLSQASAVAANITAADLVEKLKAQEVGGRELVRNHDLTKLVGKAIRSVILEVADDCTERQAKKLLKALAEEADNYWEEVASWGHPDFSPLAEGNLTSLFSGTLQEIHKQGALTREQWAAFLKSMSYSSGNRPSDVLVQNVSMSLEKGLGRHLFELLKLDFERGGKAYPALQILLQAAQAAKLDKMLQQDTQKQAVLLQEIDQVRRMLGTGQQSQHSQMVLLEETLKRLERLIKQSSEPTRRKPRQRIVELISSLPRQLTPPVGRDELFLRLDEDWNSSDIRISCLQGWGGEGKSAIASAWLDRMSRRTRSGIERIIVYSFYKQGLSEGTVSADYFLNEALARCGDPSPAMGTQDNRGNRLAKLLSEQCFLIILDGLETVQERINTNEARIKEPGVFTLLSQLALSSRGHVLLTSRLPITDLRPSGSGPVVTRRVGGLSPDSGANLLHELGVKGGNHELKQASLDVAGHCLALHLLAGYLRSAHAGDVCARHKAKLLAPGLPGIDHARRLLEAYVTCLKHSECAIMRSVSLFDRPATPLEIQALRESGSLSGHTNELPAAGSVEWLTTVNGLREVRLLTEEDPESPGSLDCHPLIREFFVQSTEKHFPVFWKNANDALCMHYRKMAGALRGSKDIENLMRAIFHGCRAQLHSEMLHRVYLERIMEGEKDFAANELGMTGSVVACLSNFFENSDWTLPSTALERHDRVLLLKEAGRMLTAQKGYAASPIGVCYRGALSLLKADDNIQERFDVLLGLCRHHRLRGELQKCGDFVNELSLLAANTADPDWISAAERALCSYHFYRGEFQLCRTHAHLGEHVLLRQEGGIHRAHMDLNDPILSCQGYRALAAWFLGNKTEACRLSKEAANEATQLGQWHTVVILKLIQAMISHFCRDPLQTATFADAMCAIANEKGFTIWSVAARIMRSWATSALDPSDKQALPALESAIDEWIRLEAQLFLPYWHGLAAEAAIFNRQSECAERHLTAGLRRADDNHEFWWRGELLRQQAYLWLESGARTQFANQLLRKSVQNAREQEALPLEVRALLTQALYAPELKATIRPRLRALLRRMDKKYSEVRDFKKAFPRKIARAAS